MYTSIYMYTSLNVFYLQKKFTKIILNNVTLYHCFFIFA